MADLTPSESALPRGRPRRPAALDLFSGCGGLTEGLRQAGFKVVGAIECDLLAVETYRANHKSVKVEAKKIELVDPGAFRRRLKLAKGELDLMAGCPPCQGFSSMTTLNGKLSATDERNDLVFQFVRFASEFLPRIIMMENVPGLASDPRFEEVCNQLSSLGYDPDVRILNAADYNVPQRRKRMILLAALKGKVPFAGKCDQRKTVRDAFAVFDEQDFSRDELHNLGERRSPDMLKLIREIPKDGGSRLDRGRNKQRPCHLKDCDGFKDVYGRMAWGQVAPTITGGCCNPSKGRFLHPEQDRNITLREAAILQTFPPMYSFCLKRGKFAAAQMIGNALPPEFIRRQAVHIIGHLRQIKEKLNPPR
jgi:DNA (cytosine-5)-methyltransferase 1